jgi:hypothetical protein
MSIPLTVNNNTFQYPSDGEDPGWGADATDWAAAVTDVLSTLVATNDILTTSYVINNNVVAFTDINRLFFDPGTVRAANVNYSIYRVSTATPSGTIESGTIYLTFDNAAAPGSKWLLGQQKIGDAGIIFNITDTGQIQYKSTDITAPGYSGTIKFNARTLEQ